MTISGCSSTSTVIPPRTPWRSTVTGSAHAAQRSQRGSRSTRVAPIAAASVTRPTTKPTPRLPYSTSAWKFFSGRKDEPQRGQLSHPSPEPVRRTVAPETTIEEERGERDVGKQREGLRGDGEARPGDLRRVGFHQASGQAGSLDDLPDAGERRARASAKAASSTAPFSAGSETSRPPAVCGSKPSVPSSSGRPSSRAAPATNSRFRRSPPVRRPRRATASAPGRAGNDAGSRTMRHAASLGHLVRMAEEAEAGHVGDRGRLEGAQRSRRRGRSAPSSSRRPPAAPRPPGPSSARPSGRAPCRAASSGTGRRRAGRRSSARSRPDAPCRRRRGRTSARRRESCGRPRAGRRPPRPWPRPRRRPPAPTRSGAPPGTRRRRARGAACLPWRRRRSAR